MASNGFVSYLTRQAKKVKFSSHSNIYIGVYHIGECEIPSTRPENYAWRFGNVIPFSLIGLPKAKFIGRWGFHCKSNCNVSCSACRKNIEPEKVLTRRHSLVFKTENLSMQRTLHQKSAMKNAHAIFCTQ